MKRLKKTKLLLLFAVLSLLFNVQATGADYERILIDPNGNFYPTSAPISKNGDTYQFTGNITSPDYLGIEVQRPNIIIDGKGYTLAGPGYSSGFALSLPDTTNVTIKNTVITDFDFGIHLGTMVYENVICQNTIKNCDTGVRIESNCSNNQFYHNNFINNSEHVDTNDMCTEGCHNIWDANDSNLAQAYISGGNFWDDHKFVCDLKNGLEQNIPGPDGICDRAYEINADNIDQFPSIYSYELSVHNIETGADYFTIQQAVNDANPGDIIRVSPRYQQYTDTVDGFDLASFVDRWLDDNCDLLNWCDGNDIDRDGNVNFHDFAYLAQSWLFPLQLAPPYYENIELDKLVWLIGDGPSLAAIDGVRKKSVEPDHVVEITADSTRIEGLSIQNAGENKYALYLENSKYNNIVGNTITKAPAAVGFYNGAAYNNIVDNDISDTNTGIFIYESNNVYVGQNNIYADNVGVRLNNSHNANVLDNRLDSQNYAYAGASLYADCKNNNICGNYFSSNNSYGICVNADQPVEDANNAFTSNIIDSNDYGIEITRVSRNTVSDNQITSRFGVSLCLAPDSVILANVMESADGGGGILLQDSNDVNCLENKISASSTGISILNSENCNVKANEVFNNSGSGISVAFSDCNITGNIVKSNNTGVNLNGSSSFVIQNAIIDNDTGINATYSSDNWIYRNILVNTTDNAVADDGNQNYWDDGGSPARGNFWSDYAHKYPDAEQMGGSLIWDTPYEVTASNNVDFGPVILTSYKITKPLKPEMKKPYTIDVNLVNDTNDFWEPGMNVDFCGVEQTNAHPPSTSALWPWDWTLYDVDNLKTYEFPSCIVLEPTGPNRSVETSLTFTNDWHWIEPMDWKDVVMDIILGEVSTAYSVVSFIEDCYSAYCAVPSVTYTFMPYNSPLVVFSTDLTLTVPFEKQEALYASLIAEELSIIFDILAAACATNPFTLPAAAPLKVTAIVYTAESIIFYYIAEDPDPDYNEIAQPSPIPVPDQLASLPVNSAPEGIAKCIGITALQMISLRQASKQSYTRYDFAKTAEPEGEPNEPAMALQLGAALRYNAMVAKKLCDIQRLTAVLIQHPDMPEPNDAHLVEVRTDFNDTGELYPIQKEIFQSLDFSHPNDPCETDIIDMFLTATATTKRTSLYADPNNVHAYQQTLIQDCYIAEYALRAAAEAHGLTETIALQYPNDVAVISVRTSAALVPIGDTVDIEIELENNGTGLETFDVNVQAASTIWLCPVADLPPGQKHTITLTWDTSVESVGCCTIDANAVLLDVDDSFPADNTSASAEIKLWAPFDDMPPDSPVLDEPVVNGSTVELSWSESTDDFGLAGYRVERKTGTFGTWLSIGYASATYYSDEALTPAAYYYRVIAYDYADNTAQSNEKSATVY